ncbi:hypothetical protein [Natrialba swarupiae]|uniref:ArsR family transcriptional regulator n=1 Tax=Natrialba swarupiae TaxID=2448032 RepID=A0A5D5AQ71_9EURY|nr:hypothetical protein [Natrialba swarupiae]TYT61620.1 hypothetical protein FYC77_13120 [Natrialba swarupiae]
MGFDNIAEALGDQTRRQILLELLDHNPVEQPEVVTKKDARENEKRELELVHHHLPKLDDMDYIVWNRDKQNIVKGPNWEEIEPIVRLLSDNRERLPDDTF